MGPPTAATVTPLPHEEYSARLPEVSMALTLTTPDHLPKLSIVSSSLSFPAPLTTMTPRALARAIAHFTAGLVSPLVAEMLMIWAPSVIAWLISHSGSSSVLPW